MKRAGGLFILCLYLVQGCATQWKPVNLDPGPSRKFAKITLADTVRYATEYRIQADSLYAIDWSTKAPIKAPMAEVQKIEERKLTAKSKMFVFVIVAAAVAVLALSFSSSFEGPTFK